MNDTCKLGGKLRALHAQVWKRLHSVPGIVGLGIGVRGWRIYLDGGVNRDGRGPAARIPSAIAGFPTEIIFKQASFLCYGNSFQATLKPGIEIASKSQDGGTLGCFARLASDSNTIVLLSNSHVLYGDIAEYGGSGAGNDCGQPSVSCCCCCTSHVIGTNRGNGANAFNRVHVHVTHPNVTGADQEQFGSEIDCGAAVLNSKRAFTNQSDFYGMISGAPAAGSLGVAAGDAVEKVGSATGHTKGTICEFNFTSATYVSGGSGAIPSILFPLTVGGGSSPDEIFSGARGNINQFFVLPDPSPDNPSRKMFFADSGDSGSAVVNSAKQVIGLVTRVAPLDKAMIDEMNLYLTKPLPAYAGNLGIVCPIGPILKSLGIEIVNNMQGTVATSGPLLQVPPEELVQEREQVLILERKLQDLEREIRQKTLGREIMDRIAAHRPEVARLVEQKRAVTAAWHRGHGPAYAAHCLHSFKDQDYRVPSEIDGVTPLDLVKRMAQILKTQGSERLQTDVRQYEKLVLDLVANAASVWELVDRVRKLNLEEYEPKSPATVDESVCK